MQLRFPKMGFLPHLSEACSLQPQGLAKQDAWAFFSPAVKEKQKKKVGDPT